MRYCKQIFYFAHYFHHQLYDKKQRMMLWKKDETPSPEPEEAESTFDIILCEFCDAEFYSDEAYMVSVKLLIDLNVLNIWGDIHKPCLGLTLKIGKRINRLD